MNFDLLESFVRVERIGSFSKAAESLYIPQPTLSNRIRQLEEELGVILFVRNKSSIYLTDAGKCFYPYVMQVIDIMNQAKSRLLDLHQGYKNTLNIAFHINFFYSEVISELMPILISQFPDIKFSFSQITSNDIISSLQNNAIDLGVTPYHIVDKNLIFQKLHQQDIKAIVSPKHPFAKMKELSLEEVCSYPLISFKLGTLYKEASLETIFRNAGIFYRVIAEINDLDTIKEMVKKNLGICLLPSQFVQKEYNTGELISIPLKKNPFPPYTTYIAYRKDDWDNNQLIRLTVNQLMPLLQSDNLRNI